MTQTIMIIDDEIEILDMLKRYFSLEGYHVITAAGGKEALQKLSKQPDLILLDINMPDIDGLSLCKSIRDFVTCPILFLTANTENSDKIKGFGAGGDDYIIKPFSVDELGARVSAHLRRENRSKTKSRVLFDGQLAVDYLERTVYWDGKDVYKRQQRELTMWRCGSAIPSGIRTASMRRWTAAQSTSRKAACGGRTGGVPSGRPSQAA